LSYRPRQIFIETAPQLSEEAVRCALLESTPFQSIERQSKTSDRSSDRWHSRGCAHYTQFLALRNGRDSRRDKREGRNSSLGFTSKIL